MARVQLALNVSDLEESIKFYSMLFGTQPHKRRTGYANFQIAEPPLKLVLVEVGEKERGSGPVAALNHLGVEVETTGAVGQAMDRLSGLGLATREEMATVCCHAEQDKVWVNDPAGTPWEIYTITGDEPVPVEALDGGGDSACCASASAQDVCC